MSSTAITFSPAALQLGGPDLSRWRCAPTSDSDVQCLQQRCTDIAKALYPDAESIHPVQYQGGCGWALLVHLGQNKSVSSDLELGHERILQFRPPRYDLNISLVHGAREIYGALVPLTVPRGVALVAGETRHVYEMSIVPGVRLSELLPRSSILNGPSVCKLERLLRAMVEFFATGWRRDTGVHQLDGRVGSSIIGRLQHLSRDLPTPSLQERAQMTSEAVQSGTLAQLPVVLNHGDLLPSNIMVDPETWELRGLIDWAEAEYLPFGISLYFVDHLLGFLEDEDSSEPRWMWYEQFGTLRKAFSQSLTDKICALQGPEVMKAVRVARDVGVLLWHGFAWDDGKIDRVVNAVDDKAELEILRAFLQVE